jgi:diguanylate cyclase (GGDEF)-like protein
MDASQLIPLIAAIAYIPLFVILLSNRPWSRKHRLFLVFLISASLWSFCTFLSRSDLLTLTPDKKLEVGIAICLTFWMLVQLHYFVRSFYKPERTKIPLAYIFVMATIVLVALGKIPGSVDVIHLPAGGINVYVDYGPWTIAIVFLFLFTVGINDIVSLWRRQGISPDPAERNRIAYLLVAIGVLTAFLSVTISPWGERFPLPHIGNFIVACVFIYAIVAHRLLDVRVIARQAVIYVVLYGGSVGIVLLLFTLVHRFIGFELNFPTLAITIGLGIPAILLLVHKVHDFWQRKVEEAFIGARYPYLRQLSQFITRIHSVPTLEQLGSKLISLTAQSIDCRRACLLLPEAGNGGFSAQFIYPPVEDNPLGELKLRQDSPVVTWLKQKGTILMQENLDIFPEFQSIWQEEREEIRSAGVKMFVPLINMKELVAVLAISERRGERPYTVENIDLLDFVSARLAASIEKEHLHALLKEQDEEITLVNRLTTILTSSVSIQMIFEGFAQELKKVVDIDWASIALIDGDELYFLALSSNIGSAWQTEERIPLKETATEWVCREKKSLYEPDLKRHQSFWTGEYHLQQGSRSIIYLPLNVTDRIIGSLILASRKLNAYNRRQIKLLERVASQIAAPVENAQLYALVEQRSRIDELTGLFNRRHFEELLKEEISRHSRYGEVLSIFILDLDNFKSYNDVYGHPAGDILLNQIGKIIKGSLRNVDKAFRYGGDEFVAILPQTDKDDAYVVAERVRGQLAGEMEKRAINVTCSIGLASYPADGVLISELVDVADTALYYAKRTGGNRIYLSSKILPRPLEDGKMTGIDTRRDSLSAVYALVSTVEAKDPYTYGHSKKVNTYAVALAERIGLSPDDVFKVSTAALIHDIGIIGIPDRVLNKKGELNEGDLQAIQAHPKLGATIIGNISSLAPCVSGILHHHERWDGGGYPEGLKGEEIPIEARILAITDSFAAMTSARPYRPPLSREEIIKELRKGAGTQFDPKLVEVFIGIVEAGLSEKVKIGQDASREQESP